MSTYYTTCLVYAAYPDESIAASLTATLRTEGIIVATPADVPGVKLHKWASDNVATCDRMIVVCSPSSIVDGPVINTVNMMRNRERLAGGAAFIIPALCSPIALDRRGTLPPMAEELRQSLSDRVPVHLNWSPLMMRKFILALTK